MPECVTHLKCCCPFIIYRVAPDFKHSKYRLPDLIPIFRPRLSLEWMKTCTNGKWLPICYANASIASALSTAFTIYPCQIRVHQRWQSKLQLPTARKKEWRSATAYTQRTVHPRRLPVICQHCDCDAHYWRRSACSRRHQGSWSCSWPAFDIRQARLSCSAFMQLPRTGD